MFANKYLFIYNYFCFIIENYFTYLHMRKPKQYTMAQFAQKIGVSRATIWRWVTKESLEKRLKMYDARKIEIAGKVFIEV